MSISVRMENKLFRDRSKKLSNFLMYLIFRSLARLKGILKEYFNNLNFQFLFFKI